MTKREVDGDRVFRLTNTLIGSLNNFALVEGDLKMQEIYYSICEFTWAVMERNQRVGLKEVYYKNNPK